jgi:hypothetical protein
VFSKCLLLIVHLKVKLKVDLSKAKPAPRQRRTKGHRGSYPVGGGLSIQGKGKGKKTFL